MPPKRKSKSNNTGSPVKNEPKVKKIAPKNPSPVKTRSKRRTIPKTPENKIKSKAVSAISSGSSSVDPNASKDNKNRTKDDILITPKVMKYYLNAYKQSPEYDNLKKKRFNTGFHYERPRGCRDIQIFTPEEDNSPKWTENFPKIENKIKGAPGETYADVFMSLPDLSDWEDEDMEPEVEGAKGKRAGKKGKLAGKKGKKGRKKSIGYKGVPLSDECLLVDYTSLL